MGGEKWIICCCSVRCLGSPPHGRGKVIDSLLDCPQRGITPAWAGKRRVLSVPIRSTQDHPRIGGEKGLGSQVTQLSQGSPPRRRGKDAVVAVVVRGAGITPAWAGKSCIRIVWVGAQWDHPRVGGEKLMGRPRRSVGAGSPPRGRGKAEEPREPGTFDRITPAWAGKSPASQPWSPPLWMMVIRPRP